MKNSRRIIGIFAALVLAVVGTISLIGYVNSAKDDAVADEELVDVYIVEEFVPKGADPETIKASVEVQKVPARLKQEGAITGLDGVGVLVAAEDLQVGDQLLVERLAERDEVIAEVTDKVQISALLEAERAVGGALKKGDLVGVYLSFEPFDISRTDQDTFEEGPERGTEEPAIEAIENPDQGVDGSEAPTDSVADDNLPDKTPNVSRLEFRHVLVTNVQTINAPVVPVNDGEDDTDVDTDVEQVTGTQYVVTLALSAEESERFVFATEFGHVWLSIDPATVADDGTRIVTLGDVYEVVKP